MRNVVSDPRLVFVSVFGCPDGVLRGIVVAVYVILGRIGHGKSTFAAKRIRATLAAGRRTVAANFPVEVDVGCDFVAVRTAVDALGLSRADVYIDEAWRWFNRTNWRDTSLDEISSFKQCRKDSVDLYLIAHRATDIHSKLWELVDKVFCVKRLFGPGQHDEPSWLESVFGCWSVVYCHDAADWEVRGRRSLLGVELLLLDEFHGCFDSYFVVGDKRDACSSKSGALSRVCSGQDERRSELVPGPRNWNKEVYYRGRIEDAVGSCVRFRRSVDDSLELVVSDAAGPSGSSDGPECGSGSVGVASAGDRRDLWRLLSGALVVPDDGGSDVVRGR